MSPASLDATAYGTPLFSLVAALTFYVFGLHRAVWSYTSISDLVSIVKASTWAVFFLLFVIFMVDRLAGVPRSVPLIQWFILIVLLSSSRIAYRFIKGRAQGRGPPAAAGWAPPETPVLLYGCGPMASLFVYAAQSISGARLRVVGIVDDVGGRCGRCINHVPVLGQARDLDRILAELAVCGVHPRRLVIACAAAEFTEEAWAHIEVARSRHALEVEHLPDILGLGAADPDPAPGTDNAWGERRPRPYFRARRLVDAALSAAALFALAPVIAAAAALVLFDVGRPVLFRQVRPGRHMRPFTLCKFRTMKSAYDEATGTMLDDDARTSAFGHLLRRTRLDEMPQLYNVLRGDMAFIGPRPLLPRDLPEGPAAAERAALRPGITGWAQVNGGQQLSVAEKMALDAWYARNAGPVIDAWIVFLTVKMMLLGERINRGEIERATAAT